MFSFVLREVRKRSGQGLSENQEEVLEKKERVVKMYSGMEQIKRNPRRTEEKGRNKRYLREEGVGDWRGRYSWGNWPTIVEIAKTTMNLVIGDAPGR